MMGNRLQHGLAQLQAALQIPSKDSNCFRVTTRQFISPTRLFPRLLTGGTKVLKSPGLTAHLLAHTRPASFEPPLLIR